MSPPATACRDIFSPAPGDNDVIGQVFLLNSTDRKIASSAFSQLVSSIHSASSSHSCSKANDNPSHQNRTPPFLIGSRWLSMRPEAIDPHPKRVAMQ
jgi:hypothetical protein